MRRPARLPLVLAGLLLLLAPAVVWAVYRFAPPAWTLAVGGPFSGPLITNNSFYSDEAEDAGHTRTRWSRAGGTLTLTDIGATTGVVLRFRASAPRPAAAPPATVTLTVGSRVVGSYRLGSQPAVYSTPPISRPFGDPDLTVQFTTLPFRPSGEGRDLGLKLEWLQVEPAPGAPPPLPPLTPLWTVILSVLGAYAALVRLRRPFLAVGGALVTLGALAAGLAQARPLLTPWLPAIGLSLGAIGALVLAAPRLGQAIHRLRLPLRWPNTVPTPPRAVAIGLPFILLLSLLGYAAYALSIIPQVDWIGHADYAENAVVARNLAAGRGPVVDYVAQFYRLHPGITHPAETWPLLQPLLTAPLFALLGAQTAVAKLPNLGLLLLLTCAVYAFARRWWDRRVALLAAAFTLGHPYFFQTVLLPINDLAFTLCALLTIGCAWETAVASRQSPVASRQSPVASRRSAGDDQTDNTAVATQNSEFRIQNSGHSAFRIPHSAFCAGGAAGLLIWSKGPSGVALLGSLVGALAINEATARWAGRRPAWDWRPARRAGLAFVITVAPLLLYNLVTLHAPFYSTESTDLWLLRLTVSTSGPAWERIYGNYLAGPLPGPALLLHSYTDLYTAVGAGFSAVWTAGIAKGEILGTAKPLWLTLAILAAAAAGWWLAPQRLRGLALAWVGAFGGYSLVVLLAWHYESRYALALVPWIALGGAAALLRLHDGIAGRGGVLRRVVAVVVLLAALARVGLADGEEIAKLAAGNARPDNFAAAGRWAAANLPPDAVVMVRNPWEFNWYAQRRAVMIPEGSLADIQTIIRQYGVTHLWLGGPADSLTAPTPVRRALAPLYSGKPLTGLPATLLYDQNYLIYRLDPSAP